MVEFDTSKRENRWIEVVAVRWDNKLGRRRLALLNIKMYYACSLSKRKIDAPSYKDSFSSIVVDENNTIKASSKLLKLFITHIAKLNVFRAKKLQCSVSAHPAKRIGDHHASRNLKTD